LEPYGDGHIHDTYLDVTPDGRVLIQRLNTDVFADPGALMRNVFTVVDHVRPPFTVFRNWTDRAGVTWRAISFVEGTRAPDPVVTVIDAGAVGRAIGAFHAAVADLDPDWLEVLLPAFHDPTARWRELERVAAASERADAKEELDRLAAHRHLADVAAAWLPPAVPVRVAHFDAKAANVLLDVETGAPVTVVDLDTVMPGSWLWDIGDMVRSTAATAVEDDALGMAMDPEKWHAAVSGYLHVAGDLLTDGEREAIPDAGPVVTWEQAVRFLTDHLAGDVYYRVTRPGHNRQRARAQLALLESMEAQRSAMMLPR
jgi:N-acetylhexosamine 1-kinase